MRTRHARLTRTERCTFRRVLPSRWHGSALLATLCFVAALGVSGLERTLHYAFVTHGFCEHGLTVGRTHDGHTAEQSAEHAARTHDDAPLNDEPAARQGDRHDDGHEHCGWAAVQSAVVPALGAALPTQLLDWQRLALAAAPTESFAPVALLSLAPKSSPPLVG